MKKNRDWIFFAKTINKQGTLIYLDIGIASQTPIKRHTKIRANATPYDPEFKDYLEKRIASRENKKKMLSARPKRWLQWWEGCEPQIETEMTGLL